MGEVISLAERLDRRRRDGSVTEPAKKDYRTQVPEANQDMPWFPVDLEELGVLQGLVDELDASEDTEDALQLVDQIKQLVRRWPGQWWREE